MALSDLTGSAAATGSAVGAGQAASGCAYDRACPISNGPCTGACVFAEVMQSQSLGVVVFDCEAGSLVFSNREAREILERCGQPVEHAALRALFFPEGCGEPEAARSSDPVRLGSRLLGFTRYRSGHYSWVLLRDITTKARLESIAEAVEQMNNIGYVFAAVRHELGNPINSLKAALSVLRTNLGTYSQEAVADYLDRMNAELVRVENLLRSLRTFSLFERPDCRPVDLATFLGDFSRLVRADADRREVALMVRAPRPVWAQCDPRALQQVLLNLFANAADAVRGQVTPTVRLAAELADDGLAHLTIQDNGIGMGPEERANLFRPFHTSKPGGTGLGMVISRKMVVGMSGTISVESEPGKGTSVTVALPAAPPAGAAPP